MTDTNKNQQIDLNAIYGLDACNGYSCKGVSNTVTPANLINYKPSLERIASYVEGDKKINKTPESMDMNMDNLEQMYKPITKEQAELYPTPAIVAAENEKIAERNMSVAPVNPEGSTPLSDAITDFSNPYPVTRESIQYLNGFIRTQIGRRVTIDFLIGSNNIQSKTGYLLAVAANYILINELDTNDVTACDFYNIKFIRFYY